MTSSGIDPRELFDDIKDTRKSLDLVTANLQMESVVEADRHDVRSVDHVHLLPIERTKRRHLLESDAANQDLHVGSIRTTSSMLSPLSMPNEVEDNMKTNLVT